MYDKNYLRRYSWYGLKGFLKIITRYFPFYSRLTRLLRKIPNKPNFVFRLPINIESVVCEFEEGKKIYLTNPNRDEIAKLIWWSNGTFRRNQDQNFVKLLLEHTSNCDYFIDIGCHTGIYSLIAAKNNPDIKVLSFDILPECIDILYKNLCANNLSDRIFPFLAGIGKTNHNMLVPHEKIGSSVPSAISQAFYFDKGVKISFFDLNSMTKIFDREKKIVVKIDVEGFESDIFRYSNSFFSSLKPIIFCEILQNSKTKEYEDLLASFGYKFFIIQDDKLLEQNNLFAHKDYRDWLFK